MSELAAKPASADEKKPVDEGEPLRSVHTTSLPDMFFRAGISLLISTYQAGKVIAARADEGKLNTHFRNFRTPMGMALSDTGRLAIGTQTDVWEMINQPDVAAKLEPAGKHDVCFLPRSTHCTGNIGIHEIAWIGKELWIVNTRFSCLCTFDGESSFIPKWRPRFISKLASEDRCHLNGLGVRDGRVKYVTALGDTDVAAGWRENKARGGVLMDVDSGEFICRGLSMPHSPRWYRDKLWVLESGAGSLAVVDEKTGKWEPVAMLPGFTRGIEFFGPLAFIGLSQVRETAVFSGIPITERLTAEERACGVWAINIETGQTVGFLQFQTGVQEIFSVLVLRSRFPEILNDDYETIGNSFMLPDEAMADVEQSKASPAGAETK